jgi:hypothetical protein
MRDLGPEIEGKINELNSKWETSKTDNKSCTLEAVNTLWSALNQLNGTVSRVVTEVTKSREDLDTLSKKLGGTVIGNTTERIILQELKRACPLDSFSNDLSLKRRTDIIGTVFDKQRKTGKISISVKNTEQWQNDFMNQLLRNMKDDGTHIRILATKSLPAEALSEQMYVPTDTLDRNVIIVVKLEFISLAYFALRHLTIHMFEKEQEQKRIDKDIDIATETVKALLKFINGEEYKEFMQCTANAIISATTTIEGLDKLKTYVETSVKNSKTLQESIAKNLEHAKDIISKGLDKILHDSPS